MPNTRATGMATPTSPWPSNNSAVNDGTISNDKPVAISPTAANIKILFITRRHLVGGSRRRSLQRFELEGQLVDLAGELEWRIVAMLHQRDPGAGVLADIEGFIPVSYT